MQTIHLANGLRSKGMKVSLLTFRPGGDLANKVQVPWSVLQSVDTQLNWWAPNITRKVGAIAPDVVILMGREANSQGYKLRKAFPDLRLICTLRTGRKLPIGYRKSLLCSDLVIANSEWAKKRLLGLFPTLDNRCAVIKNGCVHRFDYEKRNQHRPSFRKRFNLTDETIVYLMVASFRRGKNHKQLLDIFSHHTGNWELWLVGDGNEKSKLSKDLNNSNIRPNARTLHQIPELSAAYFGADIALLPTLEESLPNFLVESQNCGLPVVAYDTAGVSETFIDKESGFLVPQNDINDFRDKVMKLQENQSLRKKMGLKARDWALSEFNSDDRLNDYLKLLQNNSI